MEQILRQILEYLKYLDNPLAYWIGGSLFTYLFTKRRDVEKKAILRFSSEPIFQRFEESVRVYLGVEYVKGELSVFNAVGYLTIETNEGSRIPSDILIKKGDSICQPHIIRVMGGRADISRDSCDFCKGKGYLVPYHNPEVRWEPLCWTTPINIGEGLEGDKYCHVTHIPIGGRAKLCLCDLYRVKYHDEEFYMIKVHSEYGVEVWPRVCLRLPLRNPPNFEIIFKVRVGGENVRNIVKSPELRIGWLDKEEDYVLSYGNEEPKKLRDILGERLVSIPMSRMKNVI